MTALPLLVPPLQVPYKSQNDNLLNPLGSCNVTSVAMCLEYLNTSRNSRYRHFRQFEDELYQYMEDQEWSRHHPEHLAWLIHRYGRKDRFTIKGTIEECKQHLAFGNPCIIHGYFTRFGHIIVLVGYDERGFIVHDPYGEWFASGYKRNRSGENLHYSYNLIRRTCMHDGDFWVHHISR